MGRRIHIDFRKWPDRVHWQFEMDHLGEDAHGLWLWRRPGAPMRKGHEAPIKARYLAVKVITRDEWWSAMWAQEPSPAVYVDIATPAKWKGDRVTMVDLDLDVVRRGDGPVEIHDEDEFEDHRKRFGYPADVVEEAVATTQYIADAVEADLPPFGPVASAWMAKAEALRAAANA